MHGVAASWVLAVCLSKVVALRLFPSLALNTCNHDNFSQAEFHPMLGMAAEQGHRGPCLTSNVVCLIPPSLSWWCVDRHMTAGG